MKQLSRNRVYFALLFASRFGISLTVATYVLFLLHNGLDQAQANTVNTFFGISIFLLEVPTGFIADRYGRKASFLFSRLVCGFGFILYGLSTTMPLFILAEVMIALGFACSSGAFRAWAIDQHEQVYGERLQGAQLNQFSTVEDQVRNAASVIGAPLGALLASWYMPLSWLVGGVLFLLIGIIAVFVMKEDRPTATDNSERRTLRSELRASWDIIKKNTSVRYAMAMNTCFALGVSSVNMLWQPIFKDAFDSVALVGLIGMGLPLALFVGASIAKFNKLSGINEDDSTDLRVLRNRISVSFLLIGLGIIWFGSVSHWIMLSVAFLLHEVARGFASPLVTTLTHNSIEADKRATIDSTVAMAFQLGYAPGMFIFGHITVAFGASIALLIGGAVLIFGGALLLAFSNYNSTAAAEESA